MQRARQLRERAPVSKDPKALDSWLHSTARQVPIDKPTAHLRAIQLARICSTPRIVEQGLPKQKFRGSPGLGILTAGTAGPTFNVLASEMSLTAADIPGRMPGHELLNLSLSIRSVPIFSNSIRLR